MHGCARGRALPRHGGRALSLRDDLARLAGELRVHTEWQKETGATGCPPGRARAAGGGTANPPRRANANANANATATTDARNAGSPGAHPAERESVRLSLVQ